MRLWAVMGLTLALGLGVSASGGESAPAGAEVTDAEGKEVKVTGPKFTAGTRRLAWLADPGGATDDAKKGPLALEVREPHSTAYKQGVVTLVPLASVESVKYDYDKKVARVAVKGLAEPLAGTLEYQGLNVLAFSGTAEGKAASFRGGAFAMGNVKAVAFPDAKPVPGRKGFSAWQVQIDQPKAMNPTLRVGELKFLYQLPGGAEVLTESGAAHRGEPLKLDGSVKSYTRFALDPNSRVVVADVTVGDKERAVVIPPTAELDGKSATLVGLVAEVEAGWKLVPLHTIKGMKRPQKD
jgi:hypothetical protein